MSKAKGPMSVVGPFERRKALSFVAEAFDVFGAFIEGAHFAALDDLADLFNDVGIRERGDIAGIHAIGNGGQDAAHNFAGARFGHVGNDVDALGSGDFADHGFDGGDELLEDDFLGKHAGLERNVNFGDAALDVVDHRNDGGFGNFMDGEACGFQFLGAEAMSGNVDDVVDAAEDAVVAIVREARRHRQRSRANRASLCCADSCCISCSSC